MLGFINHKGGCQPWQSVCHCMSDLLSPPLALKSMASDDIMALPFHLTSRLLTP